MAKQSGKDIIIKVHMHCQGCAKKVSACLQGFDGVEEVVIDREHHKLIARGANVDPLKVLERVRRKHYSNAELICPKITETKKPEPPQEKPKEIPIKIIVLKVPMHCPQCTLDIRRKLFKIAGVLTAEPNMEQGMVIIKGAVEPLMLVEHIRRKLGKHAQVVSEKLAVPNKRKKEEEEKEKMAKGVVVFHYPPRCFDHEFCPCEAFNDENVHSCLIM